MIVGHLFVNKRGKHDDSALDFDVPSHARSALIAAMTTRKRYFKFRDSSVCWTVQ